MKKRLLSVIISFSVAAGVITAVPAAAEDGAEAVGAIMYTANGDTVTAAVEVTADGEERTLMLSSYTNGYITEIKTDSRVINGTETLSANVGNACGSITATVLDGDGKALKPAAVYGTDSTDLMYIKVNGEKLSDYSDDVDRYNINTDSLDVEVMPQDGGTKTEIEYIDEPQQARITVTSPRNRKREIVVSAYSSERQLSELVSLDYSYGDETFTIDRTALAAREPDVEPDNVMSVRLDPKAIGETEILVQDSMITEIDGVTLGHYRDVANNVFTYNRYAINNIIPIKNEVATAVIKVNGGDTTNEYVINFTSRQPRLTELNYTGAGNDDLKPTFIGGSAVNNDNGTLMCMDKGWTLTNISKTLVGGSCFMSCGETDKTASSWWKTAGSKGEYFNFKADHPCTVYVMSGNKLDNNTSEWTDAGWTKVNNGSVPTIDGESYGDNSGPAKRGDKSRNDYESPEYFAGLIQYNAASSSDIRCIDPGVRPTDKLNSFVFRSISYVYKNSFDADETVSICHTGRTDTLGCLLFVVVKWEGDDIFYAPLEAGSEESEDLLPELPALVPPKEAKPVLKLNTTDFDIENSIWRDLSGSGNDMRLNINDNNDWTEFGYKAVNNNGTAFPSEVQKVLKTGRFTIKFRLADFEKTEGKYLPIFSNGTINHLTFVDINSNDKTDTAVGVNIGAASKRLTLTTDLINSENTLVCDMPAGVEKWYAGGELIAEGNITAAPPSDKSFILGLTNNQFGGSVTYNSIEIWDEPIEPGENEEVKKGVIRVQREVGSEVASVMLLGKREDGESYTIDDVRAATASGDAAALAEMILYYAPVKSENGMIDTELFIPAGGGQYMLCIDGEEELLSYLPEEERAGVVDKVIANKAVGSGDLEYLCDSIRYNRLTNKTRARSLANDMLSRAELDEDEVYRIASLAMLIESLNENVNNVTYEELAAYTTDTDIPMSYSENIKDISAVVKALSSKDFAVERTYKKELCEQLFINIINNNTSKEMTAAEKKTFFEEYAARVGLKLTQYNSSGIDRQAVITQLAAANAATLASMQTMLDKLAVSPREKTDSKVSGGGGGGGSSSGGNVLSGSGAPQGLIKEAAPESAEPADETAAFSDMVGYEWAEEAVSALARKGIINGYDDNTFRPAAPVTRAEFVTLIVNAYLGDAEEAEGVFEDVTETDWFYGSVMKAYKAGIISGVTDTGFMPDEEIKRQDMAVIMKNLADMLGVELKADDETFADENDISDYAAAAVSMLKGEGIINGKDNNIFDPAGRTTRAEAAMVIKAFTDRI